MYLKRCDLFPFIIILRKLAAYGLQLLHFHISIGLLPAEMFTFTGIMDMIKYIFYILLGYVLYRFITGFVIPVFRAGRRFKKQFNEMQQRAQDQMQQENSNSSFRSTTASGTPKTDNKTTAGDYIDFEEVK